MRRSLHSRITLFVLMLWVSLFMSETEWLVRCPAHGPASSAAAVTAHHAGSMTPADHAGHSRGGDASAPGNHNGEHDCSCPGPGCCPPVVAVIPGPVQPYAGLIDFHEARAVAALERLDSATDYLLPFATAPPDARLAPAA